MQKQGIESSPASRVAWWARCCTGGADGGAATPTVRPPTQMVAPMPQQNGEDVRPVDPPTQAEAPPQRQVRPVDPATQEEAPPQVQVTPSDGHTAATAMEISDSESELSD